MSDAARAGVQPGFFPGVADALGSAVSSIQASSPTSFDIGQQFAEGLGRLRSRNLAELGQFAGLSSQIGGAQGQALGLASDVASRQIGLDASERLATADRTTTQVSHASLIDNILKGLAGLKLLSGAPLPGLPGGGGDTPTSIPGQFNPGSGSGGFF